MTDVRQGDKDKKLQLPVVCWSGEFTERTDDALFEHSGFIVLDFDYVDVNATKTSLATDDFIYSCWTSPSGKGVKALVRITNPERHRDHFRALVKYFERQYGLEVDESGINESRACFESYDPDILIKPFFINHRLSSIKPRLLRIIFFDFPFLKTRCVFIKTRCVFILKARKMMSQPKNHFPRKKPSSQNQFIPSRQPQK